MLNFLHCIISLKATTTCSIIWVCESLQDWRQAQKKVKMYRISTWLLQMWEAETKSQYSQTCWGGRRFTLYLCFCTMAGSLIPKLSFSISSLLPCLITFLVSIYWHLSYIRPKPSYRCNCFPPENSKNITTPWPSGCLFSCFSRTSSFWIKQTQFVHCLFMSHIL